MSYLPVTQERGDLIHTPENKAPVHNHGLCFRKASPGRLSFLGGRKALFAEVVETGKSDGKPGTGRLVAFGHPFNKVSVG